MKRAYLLADVVEEDAEDLCLHGEHVRRVSFVERVSHELLEERLLWGAKV